MKARTYLLLFALGLLAPLWVASRQAAPGYMDAEYYYAGGLRLAQGQGFSEQIVWNYLGEPESGLANLPRPSHAYWMPLASLLAALGMALAGSLQFSAARVGFIILAAAAPPLTAALAWVLTRRRDQAGLAGFLALGMGMYTPFLATSDVFGLLMVLGAAFFWLAAAPFPARPIYSLGRAAGLGILAGLMHLARAEGAVWLLAAWAALLPPGRVKASLGQSWRSYIGKGLASSLGYLLVMGSWFWRNLWAFGSFLAPGGSRALWLLDYNELYIFPASELTFSRWLAAGWQALFQVRLWAASLNLQSALIVQAQVFLAPLILVGWRRASAVVDQEKSLPTPDVPLRAPQPALRAAGLAWGLVFGVMTLVFPYQGARGGFFHAGAAFQPLWWALAPAGLDAAVGWLGKRRGWNLPLARRVFQAGAVGMALLFMGLVAWTRVLPEPATTPSTQRYAQVEAILQNLGAESYDPVMVNNPPGYFVASFMLGGGDRPAVAIPFGDLQAVRSVAERFHVRYLLLEFNQLTGGDDLYARPGDRPGLRYLRQVSGVQIYQFELAGQGGAP